MATIIYAASCSEADVQNAINACPEGGTVIIPAGTATWTGTGITVSKGITIEGAGAGGLLGHSDTALTLGTGLRTFALTPSSLTFSAGETVRALYDADGQVYMQGTVVSSSATSLTLNVTSVGQSTSWSGFAGPFNAWTFSTPAATTIINSTNEYAFDLKEDPDASIQLSGIHFVAGAGQTGKDVVIDYGGVNAKPVLIYDDWFSLGTGMVAIRTYTNRGIVYNCSFDSGFNSQPNLSSANDEAIQLQNSNDTTNSWSTNSAMGANDTSGLSNFYIEDNYFANLYLHAMDYSDASRSVTRDNIFDNSALGSHGPDTGLIGARYYEIYDNRFIFDNMGNDSLHQYDTYAMNWWFFDRGGTGVFANNIIPLIQSEAWGTKSIINATVMNLQRDAGPYPLWKTYPSPHQIGQGYENGSNITDPFYIWGNTGAGATNPISFSDYVSSNQHPNTADFLKEGRDYIVGTAKPGYSESQYPNSLRGTVGPVGLTNVANVDGGSGGNTPPPIGSGLAIAATDASKAEGNTGSTPFTFTVTRSGNTTGLSSVTYTVAGSGANPANATDFIGGALTTGTVSFAAGETSKLITVNVAGDTTAEANEGFTVTLSAPSAGTTIATAAATGTIVNDDGAPVETLVTAINVGGQQFTAANGITYLADPGPTQGAAASNTFSTSADIVSTNDDPLYNTERWTPGGSYTYEIPVANGTYWVELNFAEIFGGITGAGQRVFDMSLENQPLSPLQNIDIYGQVGANAPLVIDQLITVTDGSLSIQVGPGSDSPGNVQNAKLNAFSVFNEGGASTSTSASLAIAATGASKAEGDTGSTPFTFTVTRSGNTTGLSSATYTVAGSGANPANATDFSGGALPTGTVSFAAGETSKLVTINVAGDTTAEANEGFTVTLSAPSAGTTIATAAATGTIVNDDGAGNGSYSTSFPASENPISGGGPGLTGEQPASIGVMSQPSPD